MQTSYKAYISYGKEDIRFVKKLHHTLESYEIPDTLTTQVKSLYPIYLPQKEYTQTLSESERHALRYADKLIVICSPINATLSKVNEEIKTFLTYHKNTAIIALVTHKESLYFSDTFPERLKKESKNKNVTIIDAHTLTDPKAITNKLLATLLNVEGKEMISKEKSRKRNNILLDMFVISLLIFTISFIIKRWKLDPIQEKTQEQKNTYIDANRTLIRPLKKEVIVKKPHVPTESEKLSHAYLLLNQANKLNHENNNTQATKLYHQALHIYQNLDKNTSKYTAYRATAYNNLAYISSKQKHYDEAQKRYEKSLHLYKTLDASIYTPDIAMIQSNLISLYGDMGKKQEAIKVYQQAITSYKNIIHKTIPMDDIALARVYIMGHYYHLHPTVDVKKIKKLLKKYPTSEEAKELLDIFK